MIEIKETTIKDIDNIQRLWADGDVMRFVGFPNGLHQTNEEFFYAQTTFLQLNEPKCRNKKSPRFRGLK